MQKVLDNISKVIRGKESVIEKVCCALLAGGHVLLEDVPGTGKTILARCLAQSLQLKFARLQCTPDLLPSDITGVSVFHPQKQEFEFHRGPVFTQLLLVDEINRATPRTQSALLEAMEERQVSMDGNSYPLDSPFFLIATQNPIEYSGTFPLPEAQLDRFLMLLTIGYPNADDEVDILEAQQHSHPLATLGSCMDVQELAVHMQEVKKIPIHRVLLRYIRQICNETRQLDNVMVGVSTRGAAALMQASKALAYLRGHPFVTPDHIQLLARDVLAHRLVLNARSNLRGEEQRPVIDSIIAQLAVPIDYRTEATQDL